MKNESYSKISITKNEIRIEIYKYATHVKKTKNSYTKINGQSIYSGTNHFVRNKIMYELKKHIAQAIPDGLDLSTFLPLEISMEWHTVPNYETVKYSKIKNSLIGGIVEKGKVYEPSFDVDNQWIWIKAFTDVISNKKEDGGKQLIPDDTVKYIPCNGGIKYVPVDSIENRKLVFIIHKHKLSWKKLWMKYFKYWGN